MTFVICTERVLSEAGNEILHEDVIYIRVRIKIVQNDLTSPSLDIYEFSKILAFKVTMEPSDNVAEKQVDDQGFVLSRDRG